MLAACGGGDDDVQSDAGRFCGEAIEHRDAIVAPPLGTDAEVAATLDLSESTVKVRLHRARAMLREGLGVDERVGHMDAVWAFDGERCDRIVVGVMRRVAGSP